ncbi:MAG: LPXTG cell wall anchor domain-containing protein, partial [Yaniella sp.]|uniref:LPXTG cell wall anchor domain-containing protein n=1 Tax=Yaniella sp. TaxID=2773929 RepID=UPI003F9A0486
TEAGTDNGAQSGSKGGLANTGAQVAVAAGAGVLLLVAGGLAVAYTRRRNAGHNGN